MNKNKSRSKEENMKKHLLPAKGRGFLFGVLCAAFAVGLLSSAAAASQIKIIIMQDKAGEARKYRPLMPYFKAKGIDIAFVGARNYEAAAKMFAERKADAMFSGSGVAGSMIIKGVAYPAVRPLGKDGSSTYWAVILAPRGSPTFTGSASYFTGKTVIFCSLASSGEFYFRSIGGHNTAKNMLKAGSHGSAIDALSKGLADVAIVKNRVWENMKARYRRLQIVGVDTGENPNGTLIISKRTDRRVARKFTDGLLKVMTDPSAEARAIRDEMKILGYIKTSKENFDHTLSLLKRAGVNRRFNFAY